MAQVYANNTPITPVEPPVGLPLGTTNASLVRVPSGAVVLTAVGAVGACGTAFGRCGHRAIRKSLARMESDRLWGGDDGGGGDASPSARPLLL